MSTVPPVSYLDKIKSREELAQIVSAAKADGVKVAHCHGCFDILHPGHLRHLTWAASQGDMLVVTVSSDAVVGKGSGRPYVPERLRAETLAAIEVVAHVAIDDGEWAGPILELLEPDIYIKGKEFEDVYDGRFGRERRLVESYGGRVMFSSGDVVYSSSHIIDNHRERLEPIREHLQAYCARQGITVATLERALEGARGKRVLVLGETIVDRYVHTDPVGMSADSPVLVVRPKEEETFIGAASIVAAHVASLGAIPHLVTVVGDDSAGEEVRASLESRGLSASIVVDPTRPTIVKKRYLAEGKKLLNVNTFREHRLDAEVEREVLARVAEQSDVDAVIVSDFSYGAITDAMLAHVAKLRAERGIPVAGDVQLGNRLASVARVKGVSVITPSEREARVSLSDKESGVADLGVRLLQETGNDAVCVTLGGRGMMVVERGALRVEELQAEPHLHELKRRLTIEYLPAVPRVPVDPMGAGDAALAAMTCALAGGGSLLEAAFLGNCAGAVEVGAMGNVPVSRADVLAAVRDELQEPS